MVYGHRIRGVGVRMKGRQMRTKTPRQPGPRPRPPIPGPNLGACCLTLAVLLTGGCGNGGANITTITSQCPDPVNMIIEASTGECVCDQAGFELIDNRCCDPSCDGLECGIGGCGQDCGDCPQSGACIQNQCCEPSCDGFDCGNDGCGGQCGTCPESEFCTPDGQCCGPNCDGKVCGDDGCGGSCGNCPQDGICSDNGQSCECAASCTDGLITNPDCSYTACSNPDDKCIWDDALNSYDCLPKCKPDNYGELHFSYVEGDLDGNGQKDDSYDDLDHNIVMNVGAVVGDGIISGKFARDGDVNACVAGEVDRYRLYFECGGTPKVYMKNSQGSGLVHVTTDAWTATESDYSDTHPPFHGQMDIEVECTCPYWCVGYFIRIEFFD
jgi:hypothetical protein